MQFGILEPIKYTASSASSLGPHQTFSYIGQNIGLGIPFITSGQSQRRVELESLRHETETRSRKSARRLISREAQSQERWGSRKVEILYYQQRCKCAQRTWNEAGLKYKQKTGVCLLSSLKLTLIAFVVAWFKVLAVSTVSKGSDGQELSGFI